MSGIMLLESLVHGLYLDACALSISLIHSACFHQISEVMCNIIITHNMAIQDYALLSCHLIKSVNTSMWQTGLHAC